MLLVAIFLCLLCTGKGSPSSNDGDVYNNSKIDNINPKTAAYWNKRARSSLRTKLGENQNYEVAKNVIIFVGGGLSIPTSTGARIFLAQQQGKKEEDVQLSFHKFPYLGFTKIYCVDQQTGDSACAATAILNGVKSNALTIGVTGAVSLDDCNAALDPQNRIQSIIALAQRRRKRTGFVTTSKVTETTSSAIYAHAANKLWQSDADMTPDIGQCPDIASQLINGETGSKLNVILGGGRAELLPASSVDEDGQRGKRSDGQNLIKKWKEKMEAEKKKCKYVYNAKQLADVNKHHEHVLGLFDSSVFPFNLDRDNFSNKPELKEMVKAAIRVLSGGERGYVLIVDHSLIDYAHHLTQTHKAFDETIELHKAVQLALKATNKNETLILVTGSYGETLTISGNPYRGNDIFGVAGRGRDGLFYTALNYANGPGHQIGKDGFRYDLAQDDWTNKDYLYPSLAPVKWQNHEGSDVVIYASGPRSHLFSGTYEQNVVAHLISWAADLREHDYRD